MTAELRFDGQVVLVTGGGRGIGRAHALAFAARGARVVVNDLGVTMDGNRSSGEAAARVAAEIRERGGSALADANSVATVKGAEAMVAKALDEWGRLDVVVNNAGIGAFTADPAAARPSVVDAVLATHLAGPLNVLRVAWPAMVAAGGGRIVNTASSTALGVDIDLVYPAAKAGVVGLTKCLALIGEADGIKVNAIMPIAATRGTALVEDDRTRAMIEERFPVDLVSPAALWLAHESVPVTGEVFSVGAGRVARVVTMVNPGYTDRALTPESIGEHLEAVLDLSELHHVARASDDTKLMGPQ